MKKINAGDPESSSADVVVDNLERLKGLFPDAFTEGNVDFDVLRQLLGDSVDESDEKYGLSWHGKRRARQLALTPSTGTLRPCPEESVHWDKTRNLMIEGDNLEVLKLLQKSYAGMIKLVFIDPPYNSGKDFVYADDYRDNVRNYLELTGQVDGERRLLSSNREATGRFHTNWLDMIYPRLRLARVLLRQDGFIFITIDDTEVHNLRLILDDVFGEENFVANVVWEKKYTRANDAHFFSDNHDHVLVYARDKSDASLALQPRNEEQLSAYRNPDGHPTGPWKATPLHAKSGSNSSPFAFSNGVTWSPPTGTYRRFSDESMARMDKAGEIWFGGGGSATPARKSFLSETKPGVTPVTIWAHADVGHTHEANNELKALLGQGVFSNPKPTRLVRRALELATFPEANGTESIVLDFFAGSGTTGHAVLDQNAADRAKRRYILVQFPEEVDSASASQMAAAEFCNRIAKPNSIAEITKERLRRAAKKVAEENPEYEGDLGFRVLKLDASNIRAWEPAPDDLEGSLLAGIDHVERERTELDILTELLLKLGLDLCVPIETRAIAGKSVHSVGVGTLMVCLDEDISIGDVEPLGEGISEWHDALGPTGETTVVFRDNAFVDDVVKTNLVAILEQGGLGNVRSL